MTPPGAVVTFKDSRRTWELVGFADGQGRRAEQDRDDDGDHVRPTDAQGRTRAWTFGPDGDSRPLAPRPHRRLAQLRDREEESKRP
jgi:YD repeat-containing protein